MIKFRAGKELGTSNKTATKKIKQRGISFYDDDGDDQNERIDIIEKVTNDFKESLDVTQDIMEEQEKVEIGLLKAKIHEQYKSTI